MSITSDSKYFEEYYDRRKKDFGPAKNKVYAIIANLKYGFNGIDGYVWDELIETMVKIVEDNA